MTDSAARTSRPFVTGRSGVTEFPELDENDDTIVTVRFGGPDDPTPRRRSPSGGGHGPASALRAPIDSRFAFRPEFARHPPTPGPADFDFTLPPRERQAPPMLEVELIPLEPDEEP
ncbi:hypothetical protein NVV95_02715 [Herbiconiux sp. CPCC 205716]|uniref:Uncharacterized protein n=1 Tax=Herbiconiux gentiana TaxID=2970912 RepID=A0ABT2GCV2_9MICO|nr:hypothetical protein [Herbiconiux gentiana]MCS5713462.1 hypothetical protein [Herbiconiux gentiana]